MTPELSYIIAVGLLLVAAAISVHLTYLVVMWGDSETLNAPLRKHVALLASLFVAFTILSLALAGNTVMWVAK